MKKLATFLLLATCAAATPAFAQLRLTITSGVTDPIPLAVVPFARSVPADGGLDVAQVIQRDLESTGRFKAMPRADMVTTPTTSAAVDPASWKQQRNDYVVVGPVPGYLCRDNARVRAAATDHHVRRDRSHSACRGAIRALGAGRWRPRRGAGHSARP